MSTLRTWRQRARVSQLELALRSGTTQRHVSFIESGRSKPGRAMLIRLAEALDVPLRERNALLLEEGYAPAYAETPFGDPALTPIRRALQHVLDGHLPYPAVVADRSADLLACNAAFDALVRDVAVELRPSVPRMLMHPEGLGSRIVNYAEWGGHVVTALRARGNIALADELATFLPEQAVDPDHRGYAVPLRLRTPDGELVLLTTLAHFGTAVDVTVAELSLEAFLPADDATELALTRALQPAPGG
jgi:transcriptional regulator with XRE-family HTH domain